MDNKKPRRVDDLKCEMTDAAPMEGTIEGTARLRLQDSRRSWFTLAMCAVMLHAATLGSRSHGAMYVGIREHFDVSHREASFPPSLQSSLCLGGGIITGFLCEVVPLRVMSLGCSLLTALGLIACYFAPSVSFISLFFGAVHGMASSGVFVVTSVLLCAYFVRWRATACASSSAAKSSHFLTPFLANYIRVEYGTPEIFLLLGALSLNGLVAALLVQIPPWLLHPRNKEGSGPKFGEPQQHPSRHAHNEKIGSINKSSDNSAGADVAGATESLLPDVSEDLVSKGARDAGEPDNSLQEQNVECAAKFSCNNISTNARSQHATEIVVIASSSKSQVRQYRALELLRMTATSFAKVSWKVFVNPLFLLNSLSFSVQNYVLSNFVLLHLDVTLQRGIDSSFAAYLLLAFNVSVVLGCLAIGIVVDRRWLSAKATLTLGFCGNAAACEGLVWSESGTQLLACAVVQGLSCGVVAPLLCPLIIKDLGHESLGLVLGGCHTVMGASLLVRPSLIGYFKDVLGSYAGIQHIFASLNALLAAIWMARVLRSLRRNKQRLNASRHN
ncbi:hypothetical protein V5799_010027 [Amblyomma americanum]|uniref:Monocarboxylate transporter n=1 Tax=Amblyomma americanum TaxID=6943 RepID=A0AAQ4F976_AMBAM